MSFKEISYLQLWWPFCSTEQNHLFNLSRGQYKEHIYEIILNLDVVQEMLFKDISYLQLKQLFCLVDQNHLCNFGRRHYEEHFCEIILNKDQSFRRKCCLKIFLLYSSGGSYVL